MHFRPATTRDREALLAFPLDPVIGGIGRDRFREELKAERMRWPWSWLVLDDEGVVVGRALWWGRPDSVTPLALDCLHLLDPVTDHAAVAGELLQRAHRSLPAHPEDSRTGRPPEYRLTLPTHWRQDPAEITRFHAGAGAERVTATTDVTNAPMAAAFDRAGYRVTETHLMLEPRTT